MICDTEKPMCIAGVFGAIKLTRWQRTAAELESQLRSHSFELQIALEELAEKNQLLQQQTETDALSGVFNRAYFNRQMQAELKRSRREQRPLALVLLDIDYFKQVNDTHGHLAGDQVPGRQHVIDRLVAVRRAGDRRCRRPAADRCADAVRARHRSQWQLHGQLDQRGGRHRREEAPRGDCRSGIDHHQRSRSDSDRARPSFRHVET